MTMGGLGREKRVENTAQRRITQNMATHGQAASYELDQALDRGRQGPIYKHSVPQCSFLS